MFSQFIAVVIRLPQRTDDQPTSKPPSPELSEPHRRKSSRTLNGQEPLTRTKSLPHSLIGSSDCLLVSDQEEHDELEDTTDVPARRGRQVTFGGRDHTTPVAHRTRLHAGRPVSHVPSCRMTRSRSKPRLSTEDEPRSARKLRNGKLIRAGKEAATNGTQSEEDELESDHDEGSADDELEDSASHVDEDGVAPDSDEYPETYHTTDSDEYPESVVDAAVEVDSASERESDGGSISGVDEPADTDEEEASDGVADGGFSPHIHAIYRHHSPLSEFLCR